MKRYLGIRQSSDFILRAKELRIHKDNIEFELDYDYDALEKNHEPNLSEENEKMSQNDLNPNAKLDLEQGKNSLAGDQKIKQDYSPELVQSLI